MHELDPRIREKAEKILCHNGKLQGPVYLRSGVKRALDKFLTVPASPLAAGVAAGCAAVVLADDGHWPFVNLGLEKDGVLKDDINWWKVRTMAPDARGWEFAYVGNKTLNEVKGNVPDCRITRVGRPLRATHVDDVPLIFNVLGGGVSLVGPRMFSISEWNKDFLPNKDAEPFKGFIDLLDQGMKFGITGMFIIFRNEENLSFRDRVYLDVLYGCRANLAADVKILAMTLPQIRKPSG
jgi:lipopolysaccharide/colanic/teichoic acid biosynthesis glycosyltransferase